MGGASQQAGRPGAADGRQGTNSTVAVGTTPQPTGSVPPPPIPGTFRSPAMPPDRPVRWRHAGPGRSGRPRPRGPPRSATAPPRPPGGATGARG